MRLFVINRAVALGSEHGAPATRAAGFASSRIPASRSVYKRGGFGGSKVTTRLPRN